VRTPARHRLDERAIWQALATVPDPEIPAVSVVDLGIVHRVKASSDGIRVEILPTFVGCPAIEAMRRGIEERLAGMAPRVDVEVTYDVPWTTERMTSQGRRRLRRSGFAPPQPAAESATPIPLSPRAACPYCGSRRTVLENAFGPTLCRSIHYCTDCRQPFEQFKSV
jgi:ring-1,2-phenylacetyl-CoA epoxidase subunit PaaD